jgi:hypothetical protein
VQGWLAHEQQLVEQPGEQGQPLQRVGQCPFGLVVDVLLVHVVAWPQVREVVEQEREEEQQGDQEVQQP